MDAERCWWIGAGTGVVGLCVALFVTEWLRGKELHRTKGGPRSYPIVGSLIEIFRHRDKRYEWFTGYMNTTPTIIIQSSLTWRTVVTANPVNVEHILKTRFDIYPKGYTWGEATEQFLGKGIFAADDDLWRVQRKIASHEFTTRSLRDHILRTVWEETSKRLLPTLSETCDRGTSLDLQDVFIRFGFDNICQIAFGADPAILQYSFPKLDISEAFETAANVSLGRIRPSGARIWKIKRFFNLGNEKALREAVVVIHKYALDLIDARRKQLACLKTDQVKDTVEAHSDLLSRFILLAEEESNVTAKVQQANGSGWFEKKSSSTQIFSDVFLRDIVISITIAGKDTTSSGLTWFFWLLLSRPHVERAIEEEITSILKRRASANAKTDPDDNKTPNSATDTQLRSFTYEELKSMHYLHAALTEAMRLYPPVPVERKVAIEDDVFPDGTVIKKNDVVVFQLYAMGRLTMNWGPDALDYKPERWLSDGEFVPASPYKYPIFQAGPRVCLGKDMAMLQMKIVAASMIHNFKISIPQGYNPNYIPLFTLRMRGGLPATFLRKTRT